MLGLGIVLMVIGLILLVVNAGSAGGLLLIVGAVLAIVGAFVGR